MSKRFTDTNKWKKEFLRSLPPKYKLFWLYLCDDCDHAGVWEVDFDVASLRIGEKIGNESLSFFCEKIYPFDENKKWFIPSFIQFQYGNLSETNKAHKSVLSIIDKYSLPIKGLVCPLQGAKDKDKDKDKDKIGGAGDLQGSEAVKKVPVVKYAEATELDWSFEKGKFISDTVWQEKILMAYKGMTEWTLKDQIGEFLNRCETAEDYKPCSELKKHFSNWLRKKAEIRALGERSTTNHTYTPTRRESRPVSTQTALSSIIPAVDWSALIEADKRKIEADPAYIPILQVKKFDFLIKSGRKVPPDVKDRFFADARFRRLQELRDTWEEISSRALLNQYDNGTPPESEKPIIETYAREMAYMWLLKDEPERVKSIAV